MAKLEKGLGGRGTKVTLSSSKKLGKKDYELHRVEIENGDNGGATVKLHHKLKRSVEDKYRANKEDVPWDSRHLETTHPFEKRAKAMKFAKAALNEEKGEGGEPESAEEE